MALSFFETMRGHLVDLDGRAHPVDFEIKATAPSVGVLAGRGQARISGVVHAPPWAETAPLQGTLRISPLRDRCIEYRFDFGDTPRYHFQGRKDLRPQRPRRSITTLRGALRQDDTLLAEGTLRFDLDELGGFLGSMRVLSPQPRLDLRTPTHANSHAADTMRAWARAVLVPGDHVPAPDDDTLRAALHFVETMPPTMRAAHQGALAGLDLIARSHHGRPFAALSEPQARALAATICEQPRWQGLTMLLGLALKSAHFSRPDYLAAVGLPSFDNPVNEPPPRHMRQVLRPQALSAEEVVEAEVVVVGTGAGGGPVAAALAEAGYAVAIVEAGDYHQRADFSGPLETRRERFYEQGGMRVTIGRAPISLTTARMVGGSTAINSGTCLPTPSAVLDEWRRELGLPEDFQPQRWARWIDAVNDELQVAPADPRHLGRIAQVVARGAEQMGVPHGPLHRDAPGCDGQGVCPFGCPSDSRRSSNVSWVPRALRAGATLFTGMTVSQVLRRRRQAVGVIAHGHTASGAPRSLRIQARAVVVACGTLATPKLLANSGVTLPWLGRNLSAHPALALVGRFDTPMDPWDGIPQSYGVEGLVDPRLRFEGVYLPPQLLGGLLPLDGAPLTAWMDPHRHTAQYGFMVRDRGVGSVRPGPGGRPLIRYSLTPEVTGLLARGAAATAELLLRGGATAVMPLIAGVQPVRTLEQARALEDTWAHPRAFRVAGFHPLGTARMAADRQRGVIDPEHRVFGTDNLYVVDGSAVPTSLGVNPQITIMAMALRAAEGIARRLG